MPNGQNDREKGSEKKQAVEMEKRRWTTNKILRRNTTRTKYNTVITSSIFLYIHLFASSHGYNNSKGDDQ